MTVEHTVPYWYKALLVTFLLVVLPRLVRGSTESPEFDLFRDRGFLTVQTDLSPLISEETLDRVRQGVDYLLELEFRIETPRRLWGSSTVCRRRGYLRLHYRLITDDIQLSWSFDGKAESRLLNRDSTLNGYVRDSLAFSLISMDSLDSSRRYSLALNTTGILLTGINLAAGRESDTSSSPLEYLFRQFLRLTGYGKREDQFTSGTFSIVDIPSKP